MQHRTGISLKRGSQLGAPFQLLSSPCHEHGGQASAEVEFKAPPLRAFMENLKGHGVKERESVEQVSLLFAVPSITNRPVKSLGKVFDSSLGDATTIQLTIKKLETWLTLLDKSGLPRSFKAWIYLCPLSSAGV